MGNYYLKICYYFSDNDEGCIAWIHDSNIISGLDTKIYYKLCNAQGITLGAIDSHIISSVGGNALSSTDYKEKIHYTGLAPKSLKGLMTLEKSLFDKLLSPINLIFFSDLNKTICRIRAYSI